MKRLFATATLVVGLVLADTGTAGAARESWYTYWGLGWASINYPGKLGDNLETLKNVPGVGNLSLNLDLLGFYWPLSNQATLAGFILNIAGDRYSKNDNWTQVNSNLLEASALHFFGPEPGAGFFLRADLGLAWLNIDDSEDYSRSSDAGLGALVGGGYGIPISEETRILLNVNYALRRIEGENYTCLGISVGGLF